MGGSTGGGFGGGIASTGGQFGGAISQTTAGFAAIGAEVIGTLNTQYRDIMEGNEKFCHFIHLQQVRNANKSIKEYRMEDYMLRKQGKGNFITVVNKQGGTQDRWHQTGTGRNTAAGAGGFFSSSAPPASQGFMGAAGGMFGTNTSTAGQSLFAPKVLYIQYNIYIYI